MITNISNAQRELDILKSDVIGLYKHRTLGVFELVLSIDKQTETIETCFISQFGAIQRGFSVPYQQGILKLFPNNKNMNQMLENPFEWNEFIKSFN